MEIDTSQERTSEYTHCLISNVSLKYISNKEIEFFKVLISDQKFVDLNGVIFDINKERKYVVLVNYGQEHDDNLLWKNGNLTMTRFVNYLNGLGKHDSDDRYILYTNQEIKFSTTERIQMVVNDEAFLVEVVACTPDDIFNTCEDRNHCYKFRLVEKNAYQSLFDNLFLYTKQATMEDLKGKVIAQIQKDITNDVCVAYKYINFISEWSNLKKRRVLSKQLLSHIIAPSTRSWDLAADDSETTFHRVCQEGDREAVDLLLRYGANFNVCNRNGSKPIHVAAENGDCIIIQQLVARHASIHSTDYRRTTPLHAAAEKGHYRAANLLIKLGANVNQTNAYGWTSLHFASLEGHNKVVKMLIKCGANVSVADNYGWTPLHLASDRGHEKIASKLINSGIDVNAGMYTGTTALIFACAWGHEGVVRVLIEARAQINMIDDIGLSPLGAAFYNKLNTIVKLLMDAGAETIYIRRSKPPIYVNCYMGYTESLQRQIQMGIDVNTAVNEDYWRPMHVACLRGRTGIVKLLLKAGADVFATSDDGKTPIDIATENGYMSVIRVINKFIQGKCEMRNSN